MKVHTERLTIFRVIGEVLFLYGFLGWFYGVFVAFTHPEWLPMSVSHLLPWIRTDTFTVLSFIVSAIGFAMWRLAREATSR